MNHLSSEYLRLSRYRGPACGSEADIPPSGPCEIPDRDSEADLTRVAPGDLSAVSLVDGTGVTLWLNHYNITNNLHITKVVSKIKTYIE